MNYGTLACETAQFSSNFFIFCAANFLAFPSEGRNAQKERKQSEAFKCVLPLKDKRITASLSCSEAKKFIYTPTKTIELI